MLQNFVRDCSCVQFSDVEDILKETERDLQEMFDSTCSFQRVFSSLATCNGETCKTAGQIIQKAMTLCEELSIEDTGK